MSKKIRQRSRKTLENKIWNEILKEIILGKTFKKMFDKKIVKFFETRIYHTKFRTKFEDKKKF
jgi:hypothetical protein